MYKFCISVILPVLFVTSFDSVHRSSISLAKFEPADERCLVFIGQDMEAIGGLEGYNSGYCDYFPIPAGITIYTNFSPGSSSYGYSIRGNDGIFSMANWGSGSCYAQAQINDSDFKNVLLAIGLSLVGHEDKVADGNHDSLIFQLGEWIKGLDQRPVFLRIGYEFDGHEWNHYDLENYLKAFRRIKNKYDSLGIENIAYVWQSKGWGSNQEDLEKWYPGDNYVDWCSYSYFNESDTEMLNFARKHHKPVFIAEATPVLGKRDAFQNADMDDPEQAVKIWEEWFTPFFRLLYENKDVIKAVSYINNDWTSQPMWINNPHFQKVDSRIQQSEYVSKRWKEEVSGERYILSYQGLWDYLWNGN